VTVSEENGNTVIETETETETDDAVAGSTSPGEAGPDLERAADAVVSEAVVSDGAGSDGANEIEPSAASGAESVVEVETESVDPATEATSGERDPGERDPGEDADSDDPLEELRPQLSDPAELRAALEAVLFVVDTPLEVTSLAAAFELPVEIVGTALAELGAELDERGSGVELRSVAGGVRLYTRPAHSSWVEAYLLDGQRSKLSQAALETLAVIAYRQPVTRSRIAAIRGVNVDGVTRTLLSRGLIAEVGADPETGGGLYRTTDSFLEKMGLQSLDELPSLAPLLPEIDGLDIDEL
jgi:segregation and condensation protein B